MKTHELKTLPNMFQAILDGTKTFELRKDDRGFAVGDKLRLMEYAVKYDASRPPWYTGREAWVRVTYLLRGLQWLAPHHVAMSIERCDPDVVEDQKAQEAQRGREKPSGWRCTSSHESSSGHRDDCYDTRCQEHWGHLSRPADPQPQARVDDAKLYAELDAAFEAATLLANCLQVSAESVHVLAKLAEAKFWASQTPESAVR